MFDEIYKLYLRWQERYSSESNAYYGLLYADRPTPYYQGFVVPYCELDDQLIQAAITEYDLTDKQAKFIYDMVYERYHAHYDEVINMMPEWCEMFCQWEGLKLEH